MRIEIQLAHRHAAGGEIGNSHDATLYPLRGEKKKKSEPRAVELYRKSVKQAMEKRRCAVIRGTVRGENGGTREIEKKKRREIRNEK